MKKYVVEEVVVVEIRSSDYFLHYYDHYHHRYHHYLRQQLFQVLDLKFYQLTLLWYLCWCYYYYLYFDFDLIFLNVASCDYLI